MDYGQSQLEDLTIALDEQPCFVRAVLERQEEPWTLPYLEAVVGGRPPGWRRSLWEYDGVVFVAEEVQGRSVAAGLNQTDEGLLA